jgi:hypothetical protein
MGKLFGNMRGGLGISVILVGALLAASTGVVGATVVTMGLISLPAMMRAGYDPKLACGTICASGTLGQIIPPSTVLIFMGDMISGMHSQVQMSLGNFAPQTVSVGDLFAGALHSGAPAGRACICCSSSSRPSSIPKAAPRPRPARGKARSLEGGAGRLGPAAPADLRRAGLDPRRHRHARPRRPRSARSARRSWRRCAGG